MVLPLVVVWFIVGCILVATASLFRPSSTPDHLDINDVECRRLLFVACLIAVVTGTIFSIIHAFRSVQQISWIVVAAWVLIDIQNLLLLLFKTEGQRRSYGLVLSISALLTAVAQAATTYQSIAVNDGLRSILDVLVPLCQIAVCVAVAWMWASLPRGPMTYRGGRPVDPESVASTLHRLTFTWAKPLLDLGRAPVQVSAADLPALGETTTALTLQAGLQRVVESTKQPLWRSLYRAHRHLFLWQWVLTVIMSVLTFGPQVCVYYILRLLEQEGSKTPHASLVWIWAAALGAASLTLQVLGPRLMYLTFAKIEIRVRAQLSAMIFDKSLRLDDAKGAVDDFDRQEVSPQDRMSEHSSTATNEDAEDAIPLMRVEDKAMNQPRSEGRAKSRPEQSRSSQQVPNLIAVDTIRVAEISSRQHIFIGSLLTFSIALLFLVRLIGWISFTSGLLGLLLMVPMNMRASKAYGSAQHDIMGARDGKLKTLNEALRGIKQIKFTATENQWQSRVMELRRKELEKQRTSFIWAIILRLLFHSAPILLAVVSLSVYAGLNGSLSASVAFTSLGVFANIEFSFSVLPMAVMQLFDGLVSAKRIHSFLQQPEKKRSTTPGAHVSFQNATLMWPGADDYTMDPSQFRLTGIFAEFPQHELSVIHGPSGSGKSLMLASIIGEALVLEGSVIVPKQSHNYDAAEEFDLEDWILPGSLAYCAQVTWIEHASIKDNILFGLQMIQDRYQAVLAASALQPDLEILPDGDLTEVGAQGINLSGGQRWRLAFARALYSRAEILVLDDIFSAVDSHVGTHLLETLTGDLCKDRTRILATHHASRCLPRAAFAVRLGNDGYADSTNIATGHRQLGPFPSMIFRDSESTKRTEEKQGGSGEEAQKEEQARKPKVFVEEEGRQDGAVRWWTYSQYMSSSGGIWTWTSIVALVIISQLALLGRGWWLKVWTSADERPPKTAGPQHTGQTSHGLTFYLGLYIGISLVAALMEAVKCGFVYAASLRASHSLFQHLLYTVLRAKLRWLDTVPVGRILNRFTADFALVDTKIPGDTHTLLSSTFALGVVFTAGLMLSPYMAISSVAVSLLALMFTARYLPGARELRRLESTTKSPILELCGASLSGLGTIRAFGVTNRYSQRMKDFVDDYSSSGQASHLVTQWLSVRIGMLGALYAFSVAITIAALPGINASKAGLALVFALEYGKNMEEAIRRYAMLQLDMNATERILEYAEMQHEHEGKKTSPPASWPQSGQISFQGVFASYAVDLPPIIKGVSIDIEARKRVGIVGRTGAGKSSLALTMFRFIELLNGKITIDGVDISQVSLKRLRSKMAIIPQDPVLFSGTIRSNLDPFSEYSDEVLRDSLDKVHLTSQSRGQATLRRLHANPFDNLESQISDDGLNLSQGQRQLLCLARATLVQARIMVLDEATSAVDQETDVLIQATIRESFLDTTLLVIAHRLSTVADFDRIMVIHDGRIEEFGDPRSLYRAKGAFWRLANDSNDRAQLLRMLST